MPPSMQIPTTHRRIATTFPSSIYYQSMPRKLRWLHNLES